ncbi:MAG: hypothetical protein R3Y26_02295 [Rikenellaceae bacterium]
MVKIKKISLREVGLKTKLKFKLSKKYSKIKYLLRVKHFRGRDVHSPFMYGIVRKALMNRRGKHLIINAKLYDFLGQCGYISSSRKRICRIFTYLELEDYMKIDSYNNSNGLIVLENSQEFEALKKCVEEIRNSGAFAFITLGNIYADDKANLLWNKIIFELDCVAVDLYHEGLIFVNESLCKQDYKMKFQVL